jgi:hypothetical protein
LETSGYARWIAGGEPDRPVVGVVSWAGAFGFVLEANAADGGFYGSDPGADLGAGFLETSVADLSSNLTKILDAVSLTTRPLVGSIEISYSTTTNASFVSVGDMTGVGSTFLELPTTVLGASIGFRVELTPNDDVGPVLKRIAGQVHPRGLRDGVVVWPINCGDVIAGLNGKTLEPDSSPGAGFRRVKTLEGLVGSMVAVQDTDWPQERTSQVYQLMSVETEMLGTYDQNKNYRVDHGVAKVTLRRKLS